MNYYAFLKFPSFCFSRSFLSDSVSPLFLHVRMVLLEDHHIQAYHPLKRGTVSLSLSLCSCSFIYSLSLASGPRSCFRDQVVVQQDIIFNVQCSLACILFHFIQFCCWILRMSYNPSMLPPVYSFILPSDRLICIKVLQKLVLEYNCLILFIFPF